MVAPTGTGTVHALVQDGYRVSIVPSGERVRVVFNGEAVDDRTAENVVWAYEDPYDEASGMDEYVTFDWTAMGA